MNKGQLKIHSENLLPIIKRWLYSDRDIFLRELVSNACDATSKLKILRDQGHTDFSDSELRIDVVVDKEKRLIKIIDTGIGMDAEEVEKYIANLAFSGAEEFLKKYDTKSDTDQIIGHFGLGFYSAYMVAEKVEIQTHSYKPDSSPVFWSSDGSTEYEIGEGSRTSRGTEIILYVNKENDEFLDPARIREILQKYCKFLSVPLFLNDSQINTKEPLWLKAPSECKDEDYLEFFRHLYPMEPEPLFWIHLNVDYPFHLKGILYFPKLKRDFDYHKSNIQLYYNRVFVTDNCQDVIPEYLMMLKGSIDSPDIPLNVSRSSLQMDRTVRQLSTHISKKVSDRLASLYKTDKEKFFSCYRDIEVIIKLGVIQDEKFYERMKDCLVWKTTSEEWLTTQDCLERNKEKCGDSVVYCTSEHEDSHFLKLYQNQGIDVICATGPVDTHLMSFLEGKLAPTKFQRIDAAINDSIIDKSRENTLLDAEGKTAAGKLREVIQNLMEQEGVEVEAKSLASDHLPAFLVIDENMRRLRDYMRLTGSEMSFDMGQQKITFVVNTNSSLIQRIMNLHQSDQNLAKRLVNYVYDLAKMMQKEMDFKEIQNFSEKSTQLIEELVEQAANNKESVSQ